MCLMKFCQDMCSQCNTQWIESQYNMRYYLTVDIYPDYVTFVKTISMPQGEKWKLFAQRQ